MSLIFFDIETTGLNPIHDLILELAALEVDDALNPVRGMHAVIRQPFDHIRVDPYVHEMHTKNGLFADVTSGHPAPQVWDALRAFLGAGEHTMAGRSCHFDRSFLFAHAPTCAALFTNQLLDLRAVAIMRKIAGRDSCPIVGSNTHRAVDDVQADLAACRWYRDNP